MSPTLRCHFEIIDLGMVLQDLRATLAFLSSLADEQKGFLGNSVFADGLPV